MSDEQRRWPRCSAGRMYRSVGLTTRVFLVGACAFCWLAQPLAQDGAPPPGYPAVLRDVRLAFPTQDDTAIGPVEEYLQIIWLPGTNPLQSGPSWTFYSRIEPMILDSAQRLWSSGRFRSVWVDVEDDPFANGADGRRVIFNLVERIRPGPAPDGVPEPPPRLWARLWSRPTSSTG